MASPETGIGIDGHGRIAGTVEIRSQWLALCCDCGFVFGRAEIHGGVGSCRAGSVVGVGFVRHVFGVGAGKWWVEVKS